MLNQIGHFVIFLTFLNFQVLASDIKYADRGDFLNRILHSKDGPVVVFLESDKIQDLSTNNLEDDQKTDKYEPATGENEAYLLYNALRTTQDNEELDTKASRIFNKTRELLRSAFIARCQQRNSCEKKCPPRQSSGCQQNCQKVFDELDACEDEKPKCNQNTCNSGCNSGCGRTMPAKWLRSLTTLEWY